VPVLLETATGPARLGSGALALTLADASRRSPHTRESSMHQSCAGCLYMPPMAPCEALSWRTDSDSKRNAPCWRTWGEELLGESMVDWIVSHAASSVRRSWLLLSGHCAVGRALLWNSRATNL
jgi:hypothetical protein